MIQDIAPKKYDNHYEQQNPADEDWMLVYKDGQILCRFDQEKIYFPKVKETGWKGKDVTYLFTISGERFFLLKEGLEEVLPGYQWEKPVSSEMQDLSIVGLPESPVSSWIAGIDPTGSAANVENLWYQITKNVWFIVNIVEILCIRRSVRALLWQ